MSGGKFQIIIFGRRVRSLRKATCEGVAPFFCLSLLLLFQGLLLDGGPHRASALKENDGETKKCQDLLHKRFGNLPRNQEQSNDFKAKGVNRGWRTSPRREHCKNEKLNETRTRPMTATIFRGRGGESSPVGYLIFFSFTATISRFAFAVL
jgi:hypothetical protein